MISKGRKDNVTSPLGSEHEPEILTTDESSVCNMQKIKQMKATRIKLMEINHLTKLMIYQALSTKVLMKTMKIKCPSQNTAFTKAE